MAVRSILYSPAAIRTLERIDAATARRIRDKILVLAEHPEALANNIKALKGRRGFKRLRIGDWRVIYTDTLVVVAIMEIAPRGGAYD